MLVVEDDVDLSGAVERRLRATDLAVDTAATLAQAVAAIVVNEYNCLVLDRTVPDGDTIDLVKVGQSRGTGWLEAPHEGVLRRSYETLPIFGSTG